MKMASSSSSSKCGKYDVFLSFRGDTRRNLADYLARTLETHGFNVFLDENSLTRGEPITPALKQAIKDSRLAAIIFSKGYAESRWCLDELVEILVCKETMGQLVLPVFYDIDPTHVRHQTRDFEDAFQRHQERFPDKVQTWKDALNEAAELAGQDFGSTDGYEGRFVQQIVDEIARKLKNTYLTVAPNPVGIDSRVQEIGKYLDVGRSDDVRIIGIWGMGGLGKTTVAKDIFNKYHDKFAGKSFLANVREEKLVDSQNTLLYDVLRSRNINVRNVDEGTEDIKRRLGNLRVLVIVDDVDSMKQLEALAIKHDSFGPGSRIIITTRDKHLLEILEATICHLPAMDKEEALELLRCRAFSKNYPNEEYLKNYPNEEYFELAREVVDYCGGLPLALEVLGSYLFGRSTSEWKNALGKWKRSRPYWEIHKNLQISYYGLTDDSESMFLDISCFFDGMNKDYVMKILDRDECNTTMGIRELHERCLVTVDTEGNLMMHGLIRDTGREIVREKSQGILGKRCRLWAPEDVIRVLRTKTGRKEIQGLTLDLSGQQKLSFSTEAFGKMHGLRLLKLKGVKFTGHCEHLSKELSWLCWPEFPMEIIPRDFDQTNLVDMDLSHGNIKAWKDSDVSLEKLKFLNLGYCNRLIRLPDFSKIPNVERLILKGCINLQAIRALPTNLEILEADECIALEEMPDFSEMSRMRELHLNHSPKLSEILGLDKALNSMTRIHMEGCANLTAAFKEAILKGWSVSGNGGLFLPGNEIPSWFMPVNPRGETVVPKSFGCDLKALIVCIIYSSDDSQSGGSLCIHVENCTQKTEFFFSPMHATVITSHENYLWLGHLSNNKLNVKGGDKINVCAYFVGPVTTDNIHLRVKKIGINLEKEKLINEYALDCQSMPYSSECKEDCNHKAGHSDDLSYENQSFKGLRSDPSVEAEEETDEIMQEGRTRWIIDLKIFFICAYTRTSAKKTNQSRPKQVQEQAIVPMNTSTSSSSSLKPLRYDVYLSFRGQDTRGFVEHLHRALVYAGLCVFMDIPLRSTLALTQARGEDISFARTQAIEGSKSSCIVFSKNYAESRRCLDELVKIMEFRRTVGQIVVPVFYGVNPSDVRIQRRTFAAAFLKHEQQFDVVKKKLQLWRSALTEAGNLSGFVVRDGDEAKFVWKVVLDIVTALGRHMVAGTDSRVQEISNYLDVGGSDDVRIIGIWGMGGLGKTTVAQSILYKYQDLFEGTSFLSNVRERKLVDLQNRILSDVVRSGNLKVRRVDEGTEDIKRRLSNLRVLVIVDDVDSVKQLEALAIKFSSFGPGSRIIITTRDQHLLKILKANRIYHLPAMNKEEALELFSWHTFGNNCPNKEYFQVSREVVDYCGGLPLALEVLSSYLSGKSSSEWKSELEKLKSRPRGEILNRLKISFDELTDDDLKAIFLDISCFFTGMNKDYVMKILDGCDLYPEIGISVLQERCLVTTNDDFTLVMHDLLHDMGRYIVHAESPDDPGKRSRLWHPDDVIDVLKNKSGTEAIQGLTLDLQESDKASFSTEAFRNMHSLRLLKLNYVKLTGSYNNLPNELRWLCWHGFPLEVIPEDFDHPNIVVIDLSYSKLTRVWEDSDLLLEKLKFLNLSHSHNLTRSPDFSKTPNLERLILKDCKNLLAIPALPTNLEILEADECIALEKMPDFSEMSRMRELHLNHSPKLSEILGLDKALNSNSMTSIHMEGCTNLTASFKEAILQGWSARRNGGLFLPGNEIPNNMLNVKGKDKINVGAHFVGPATTDDIHVRVKKIGINLEKEKLNKEYALDSQSMPYSSERKEEGSHKAEHSDDSPHENRSCKRPWSDPSVERNAEKEPDEIMKKKREMAGALIGEAFLSASIQKLCEKIGSRELMDFFRRKKLDHSLLAKLKLTFLALMAVLDDAEEKQMEKPHVAKWLDELKHAVFDAEDLLDEIDTEVLRRKVEAEFSTKKTQVWNFLSTSRNPFYQGMNGRIHTLFETLEHLAKQKDVLGLIGGVGGKLSKRTSTSFVDHKFSTYGRDEDEEKLKTLLLSDDARGDDISVIPIVGMGGIGKTTLAQLLYNNDRVKEHFDVQAWACVSEDFDVVWVTKTLVESIASKPCDTIDMSLLQVALREQLMGKRFLFVLDDLWNGNYNDWSVLQAPFTYGARGSKVIVTTRNERVASMVHTVPFHSLKHLSDDDCWHLLAKHAFRNENASAHPDLEEIGKRIAHKCNGLPLAAKTLGDLLSCNMDHNNWNHILNSNLWELPQANSILTSLRLSFHRLPSILKQCFAYCSIFPRDYEFKKDNLVQLWMAVGLISQAGGKEIMEKVGELYFNELVSQSLIQRSRTKELEFTMHNLVNDLAMFVSREFCFRMDEEGSHEVPKRVRHFSYAKGKFDAAKKFQPLNGVKYLRTFLPMSLRYEYGDYYVSSKVPNDLLPTLKCSRAVSLARYKNISRLPDCIGNHIHLRYIDLSYTAIKRLPDTVSSLYNLQTLLLVGCYSLVELPVDMRKLINLRHLDIRDTGIKEMPVQMGTLKSLRTLTAYVLGTSTRFGGIGELGELPNLGGKLSILNLENVVDTTDALRANLKDKKDLNEIELAWGRKDAYDSIKERNVLERLQPSVNLVELTISSYGGTSFPNWLGDSSFSNIKVMRLRGFSTCRALPPVGQLPALKELYIDNMKCVMSIGAEFYGVNGTSLIQPFRSLEKLEFSEMPEWEEWLPSPGRGQCPDFPRLEELVLWGCPRLRGSLPDHLPCLKKLEVSDCGVLHERATRSIVNMESLRQSLQDLKISGCPGLSSLLETESLSSLSMLDIQIFSRTDCLQPHLSSHLQKLTLHNCGSLLSFPRNGLPTTLKSLSIVDCGRLEFLSHEMMAKLTSLQHLILSDSCDSLRSFPLGVLPKLSSLYFRGSKNLESLSIGEGVDDENFTHLDSLSIYYCRNLVSFPHGGLPTLNLACFMVVGCKNLKLLPDRIHTLTALQDLSISGIPDVESFAEGGLPPNLQSFHISGCEKLRPSVEYWGLQRLVSLQAFQIKRSEDVLEAVLKEQLIPTTLHTLKIVGMKSLKSLEGKGLQHLTSLQELEIRRCDSLKFLPKEGLPASLRLLRIRYSSSLQKRCQEKTGEEWSKIAHIPCIEIGDQVII